MTNTTKIREKIEDNLYVLTAYGVQKYVNIGREMAAKNLSRHEQYEYLNEKLGYGFEEDVWAMLCVRYGMSEPDAELEEKEYYRYGNVGKLYDGYKPSYNYANDCPEKGISVATPEWERSAALFFNTKKDKYTFTGIQIGTGGDEEPLVCPTSKIEKM